MSQKAYFIIQTCFFVKFLETPCGRKLKIFSQMFKSCPSLLKFLNLEDIRKTCRDTFTGDIHAVNSLSVTIYLIFSQGSRQYMDQMEEEGGVTTSLVVISLKHQKQQIFCRTERMIIFMVMSLNQRLNPQVSHGIHDTTRHTRHIGQLAYLQPRNTGNGNLESNLRNAEIGLITINMHIDYNAVRKQEKWL